jgi:uracil-DNA glycosylase family 4
MNIVERIKACQKCSNQLKCVTWGRTLDRSSESLDSEIDCVIIGQNPWFNNKKNEESVYCPCFGDKSEKILLSFFNKFPFNFSRLWITNAVKCSVEKNDANKVYNVFDNCKEFLKEEIETLKPKLIVTLGDVANKVSMLFLRDENINIQRIKILHPNALSYNNSRDTEYEQQIKNVYDIINTK